MFKLFLKNKSIKQTLIKNTIWLSLAHIVSRVAKFFLIALAARVLQPEGYGTFIYVSSVLALFFEFSDLGLSSMFIRDFNQSEESKKSIGTILFLKIIFVCFIGFIAALYVYFAAEAPLKILFSILLVMMILDFIKNFLLLFSFASNKSEHQAWVMMVETLLTVAFGWQLLHSNTPLEGLAVAYLGGSAIAFVCTWYLVRKNVRRNMSVALNLVLPIIKKSLPFLGSSVIASLLITTDVVMIKWLLGANELGLYSASYKIYRIVVDFGALIAATSYPILVTIHKNRDEILRLIKKISNIYLLLGLPVMCGGLILSGDILKFVFSNQYVSADTSFKCFMLIIPIQLMLFFFNRVILALNGEKINVIFASISGGINIGLNILFIPKFGITGAVLATGISKVLDFSLTLRYVKKTLNVELIDWGNIVKVGLALACMSGALYSVTSLHVLLRIFLGAIVYLSTLLLLKEYQCTSFIDEINKKMRKIST